MEDDQIMLPLGFDDDFAAGRVTLTPLYSEHNAALDLAAAHILATNVVGPEDQVAMIRRLLEALAAELGGLKR